MLPMRRNPTRPNDLIWVPHLRRGLIATKVGHRAKHDPVLQVRVLHRRFNSTNGPDGRLSECSAHSQIAITLSEGRPTTTVEKQLAFCEDRSEARRAKRPNDCHCRRLCIRLTFAVVLWPKKKFFKNSPKIACQAPKPPKSLKQNKIELAC